MAWFRKIAVVALVLGAVAAFWPEHQRRSPTQPVAATAGSDTARYGASWWQSDEASCPDGTRLAGGPPPDGGEVWCARADGTRHGQHIGWWPSGRKAFHRHYRDGKLHGSSAEWGEGGSPVSSGEYRDGLRHGRWVRWSDGGAAVVTEYEAGREVRPELTLAYEDWGRPPRWR